MTTDTAGAAQAHARVMIDRALTKGGIKAAFDQLETRLRRYGKDLTDEERRDVQAYVNAKVDSLNELLHRLEPEQVWSDPVLFTGVAEEEPPA